MKVTMKLLIMVFSGLITAGVVYPFTHESGHILTVLIFGGKVIECNLFPFPSVLTDIFGISTFELTVIGMSGIGFPFLLSVIIHPKRFALWYSVFIFRAIVLVSLIISTAVIVLNCFGWTFHGDDMIRVLLYGNINEYILLVILMLMIVTTAFLLFREHPLKRIYIEIDI